MTTTYDQSALIERVTRSADGGDERTVLEAFLDMQRDELVRRVHEASAEHARARLVPSETTLGGLVKHMRWVEMGWFQRSVDHVPDDRLPTPPYTDEDPDGDFRMADGETLEGLVAEYQAECARSREITARHGLDDIGPHHRLGTVTLRWVLVHMIEETARHVGHADILREQLDGVSGD